MKVLHVVEATTAGVARHVLDLCRYQREAGLSVTVACPPVRDGARRDTGFVGRVRAAGVPLALVPLRRAVRPLSDLRGLVHLRRLIGRLQPEVVHAHSSKAGVLGRLSARIVPRGKRPVTFYTPNAFAFRYSHSHATPSFLLLVERWLGHVATDCLICVGPSEQAVTLRHRVVPAGRLALVENAIDADDYAAVLPAAVARERLGFLPGPSLVGYVGRLAPQKGVDSLLRAARRAPPGGPSIHLILVGEGGSEPRLRRLASSLGIGDRVTFCGYRPDVAEILAALDVLVLPSIYEGLPYALMEGMAAGLPVIASDVPGNRDLVRHGETGLLVPPGDDEALADALLDLVRDPTRRARLGQAARAAARARPAARQMALQVVELYQAAMAARR